MSPRLEIFKTYRSIGLLVWPILKPAPKFLLNFADMKSLICFFYKRLHKLIKGKIGLKYVATTKYNLINKVLE